MAKRMAENPGANDRADDRNVPERNARQDRQRRDAERVERGPAEGRDGPPANRERDESPWLGGG